MHVFASFCGDPASKGKASGVHEPADLAVTTRKECLWDLGQLGKKLTEEKLPVTVLVHVRDRDSAGKVTPLEVRVTLMEREEGYDRETSLRWSSMAMHIGDLTDPGQSKPRAEIAAKSSRPRCRLPRISIE